MKYCYVIYVVSGKEDNVVKQLGSFMDLKHFSVFIPKIEKIFKKKNLIFKEKVTLLPGYVFIESELPDIEFRDYINKILNKTNNVIRLLKYGNSEEISLKESERSAFFSLCNDCYCIKSSNGIIENDRICIKDGPLMGMENKIKRISRHKREVLVELRIMGEIRLVKMALEIINKIPSLND